MDEREQLATYSVKQIMLADKALELGATADLDGMLSPSLSEITSSDLIELMSDEQVRVILRYLTK